MCNSMKMMCAVSKAVEKAVKYVDFVCHLAAVVSVPYSVREPFVDP